MRTLANVPCQIATPNPAAAAARLNARTQVCQEPPSAACTLQMRLMARVAVLKLAYIPCCISLCVVLGPQASPSSDRLLSPRSLAFWSGRSGARRSQEGRHAATHAAEVSFDPAVSMNAWCQSSRINSAHRRGA